MTALTDRVLRASLVLACALLTACASGPTANRADPLEPFNRSVYQFNDFADRTVLKPVATVYRDVVPDLVRRGVGNFFGNLEDAWSIVNNLLQFKGEGAVTSLMRVSVNTVLGLGGILDIASEVGMERFPEDFGQTLGRWGVGPGPYIVLPILGPSTLRDSAALSVDVKGDAVSQLSDVTARSSLLGLRVVDKRASFLQAEGVVDGAALDKYSFIRDAYLQRRRNAIYDGNPPDEEPQTPATEPGPEQNPPAKSAP